MRMFYIKLLNTLNDKLVSYRKCCARHLALEETTFFSKESQMTRSLKQNCLGQGWWQIKVSQTEGLY